MNALLTKALNAITARTNLATGLTHFNDKHAAQEMFFRLHQANVTLRSEEIEGWAVVNDWEPGDARDLGLLAGAIGRGRKPRIKSGPWWPDDVLTRLAAAASSNA